MAKGPTITTIASGYYSRTALNDNFTNIDTAFDNTLSLDGSTPNSMGADLDLNNNDILNAKDINADRVLVGGSLLSPSSVVVDAENVNFTPTGTIASTDVQAALVEVTTDLSASTGSSLVGYTQGGTGAVANTVQSKLSESVSVKDFGAVGDGVTDDTAAIQAAINYASTTVSDLTGDQDIVVSAIHFPSGVYKTTSAINLKNNVYLVGSGAGTTEILVSHAGVGFQTTIGTFANIHISGMHLVSGGTATTGFSVVGLLRNCLFRDVTCSQFSVSGWTTQDTWTLTLERCNGLGNASHVIAGSNTGGLHLYGGRYDVASDHGISVTSSTCELVMIDVAVQFGSKAAVHSTTALSIVLENCFFEGNCIGNPAFYYVDVTGTGGSQSSCRVVSCVMNNLSDANRDGLGVIKADSFRTFTYKERWVRNNVQSVPEVISTPLSNIQVNTSADVADSTQGVAFNADNYATIKRVARPFGFYGRDMNDPSFSPTTRSAINAGLYDIGVAIGTYSQEGAIQGYGASSKLKINAGGGQVDFGSTGFAQVEAGSNAFRGRFKAVTQATGSNLTPNATTQYAAVSCSAGNRSVTMTNISNSAGETFVVGKTDGTANLLTITPPSGTINGAATLVLNTAYEHKTLICNGTDWFVLQ